MSFKAKILLVVGVMLGVTGLTGAVTVWRLVGQVPKLEPTRVAADQVAGVAVPLLDVIKDINADVLQVWQWLTDISATRGLDGLDDGFDEAAAYAERFAAGAGGVAVSACFPLRAWCCGTRIAN